MNSTALLSQLYISPLNVRQTGRDLDIEPLADDITVHGLIEPLAVVDEGLKNKIGPMHGVIAGGRRLLALQLLAQRGWPTEKVDRDRIPISFQPVEDGREISLSENIHKVAMNAADEVEAFAAIVADYEARGEQDPDIRIERCARHFGRTPRYVAQALRLAALAPAILDALRAETITREAAKAYAGVADQALQLQVFSAQERQGEHRPQSIRTAYSSSFYRAGDRQVLFVGMEAYRAAGGRVDRDLFMGSELDEILLDTHLVDRLARERGETEAQRLAIEAGFAGAILKGWGGTAWQWPATPEGHQKVFALRALRPEDRPRALAIATLAEDGGSVALTDEGFLPAATVPTAPSTPPSALAAGAIRTPPFMPTPPAQTRENELERLARIRREKIDATALRLAVENLPLEGRIFMPPAEGGDWIARLQEDEENIGVAVYVKFSKAEIGRFTGQAETVVDHELEGRDPPAVIPAERFAGDFEDDDRDGPAAGASPREVAEWIERRIAAESLSAIWTPRHGQVARALIAQLVDRHGGRFRESGQDCQLVIAGISRSCTGGTYAALMAWAAKAKAARRVEELA